MCQVQTGTYVSPLAPGKTPTSKGHLAPSTLYPYPAQNERRLYNNWKPDFFGKLPGSSEGRGFGARSGLAYFVGYKNDFTTGNQIVWGQITWI